MGMVARLELGGAPHFAATSGRQKRPHTNRLDKA